MPVLPNRRCASFGSPAIPRVGHAHAVSNAKSFSSPGSPLLHTPLVSTSYGHAEPRLAPSNAHASGRSIASPLVDFQAPRQWGGNSSWLADCVPAIVRESRARKAPFLHLVSTRSKQRDHGITIPASVQAWSSVQSRIASSGTDALVLVRPIESPAVVNACASAAASCSPGVRSVSGVVGAACCDEEAHSLVPHGAGRQQQQAHRPHHHHSVAGSAEYFGLVVQSTPSTPSCYVLKTSSSEDQAGCTCVHYSLTRIGQDQPLWCQVMDAWRG